MKRFLLISIVIIGTWFVVDNWNIAFPFPLPANTTTYSNYQPLPSNLAETEAEILKKINEFRDTNGGLGLIRDNDLEAKALLHSQYMAKTGKFEHSDYNYYECIFMAINVDKERIPQATITAWKESYWHRIILLEDHISRCGMGIATSGVITYVTFMAK